MRRSPCCPAPRSPGKCMRVNRPPSSRRRGSMPPPSGCSRCSRPGSSECTLRPTCLGWSSRGRSRTSLPSRPASWKDSAWATTRGRRLDGARAQTGALAMSVPHPVQEFFSIGEVCQLTDLKPHVLRYWESQFRFLNPAKNRSGNRVYQRREIELIMLVKHLLYTEKYTIEGARQKIEQYRRSGELKPEARRALATQTIKDLRLELKSILALLEGTASSNAGAR